MRLGIAAMIQNSSRPSTRLSSRNSATSATGVGARLRLRTRKRDSSHGPGDTSCSPNARLPCRPHRTSSGCWTSTTSGSRLDWATGDEPMTGAQASYLETLSREAGEEAPAGRPDQGPGVRAHRRAPAADGAGRLARLTPSPQSATRPGEHHETRTTITLASKSAGRCQPNPQKLIRTRLSRR